MFRARATCPTALTDCAKRGPIMISAPSEMACWAPACAPCGVPPSSFTSSWMFGLLNSASAISAAFFIDCAATPALPCADSGRTRATRTWPSPTEALAAACSPGCGVGAPPPNCVVHAASTIAVAAMDRVVRVRHHACANTPFLRDTPGMVASSCASSLSVVSGIPDFVARKLRV